MVLPPSPNCYESLTHAKNRLERETGNGGRQGPTKLGEKEKRYTGLGSKVGPRLRECCWLAKPDRSGEQEQ